VGRQASGNLWADGQKSHRRPTWWASWHNTAKPTGSSTEVNAAVVQGSNTLLSGELPRRKCLGKSADAIVARQRAGGGRPPVETKKPEVSILVKG